MAGRKAKSGNRYASGKLIPQTDYGTAHGAMQRISRTSPTTATDALAMLTELAHLDGRLDLDQAARRRLRECQDFVARLPRQCRDKRVSYPLGVLYACGLVLSGDHYAGRRYAALFVAAVRPLTAPSILADIVGRGAVVGYRPDEGGIGRPQLELDYRAARRALEREGIRVVRVVDEVVVYEEGMPAANSPRMRWLESGLHALAAHFEIVDTARRAET